MYKERSAKKWGFGREKHTKLGIKDAKLKAKKSRTSLAREGWDETVNFIRTQTK